MKRYLFGVTIVLAMAFAACSDEHPTASVNDPHEGTPGGDGRPVTGTLVIRSSTIVVSGGSIDPDGYFIQLDARLPEHIESQGSFTFENVPVGAHVVYVTGVGEDCELSSPSLGAVVSAGQVDTVNLNVTCNPPPKLEGMLAFVSDRDGNAEIYTSNVDGTDLKRLTNNPKPDFDPAWSPDGKRIAFASSGNTALDIYVMDADGSNVVQLTHGGINSYPSWSPDGRRIAYRNLAGDYRIMILDLDQPSRAPEIISFDRGWNTDPAWSPDGKTIMFASDWLAFDFATFLFTVKTDGVIPTPVRFPLPYPGNISTYYYLQPSWSPDGTKVAFAECDYFSICWGPGRIVVSSAEGTSYRRLVEATNIESTTWSPDGRFIAYSSGPQCQPGVLCNPTSISYVTLDGRKGLILSDAYSPSWRPSRK